MLEKQISILGCGHLGLSLVSRFLGKCHISIKASTKLSILNIKGIDHYFIDIDNKQNGNSNSWELFFDSTHLVIALPPSSSPNYSKLPQLIKPYIKPDTQIVLISSVGAYANDQGHVNEETQPLGKESLVHVEENFQKHLSQTTILRLGGIVSPKRQVWDYLEGRIIEFDEYLHLVDIENCVDAIEAIISSERQYEGEIFNIVNSQRELKSSFYGRKCRVAPQFKHLKVNAKNVSNIKSINLLKINYKNF